MWMIVEIMGHTRHAGLVTEEVWAGSPVLRIEQPGWERRAWEGECKGGVNRSREIIRRYPPRVIRVGTNSLYRSIEVSEAEARAALPSTTWDHGWAVERIEGEWSSEPALLEDAEEVMRYSSDDDDEEEEGEGGDGRYPDEPADDLSAPMEA